MSLVAAHEWLVRSDGKKKKKNEFFPSFLSIREQKSLSRLNTISFPFSPSSPSSLIAICHPNASSRPPLENPISPSSSSSLTIFLFSLFVFLLLVFLRIHLSLLPHDFPQRWRCFLAFSREAELMSTHLPSHLFHIVVACEDRRFFRHCGIDLISISRAVLLFPAGGGGSTITQQLVKNVFLKHERKFSRKIVEMVLALILERKLSKWKILCSYLYKIYWGHGVYGIESASAFYFGKHPSLLSLAECAMLAGIIPSPEFRSPFKEPSRGKASQARALRKMVEAGFLDINTALLVLDHPLHLRIDNAEHADESFHSLHFTAEEMDRAKRQKGKISTLNEIWDWEKANAIWEVREYMEKWARRIQKKK